MTILDELAGLPPEPPMPHVLASDKAWLNYYDAKMLRDARCLAVARKMLNRIVPSQTAPWTHGQTADGGVFLSAEDAADIRATLKTMEVP